MQKLAYRVNLSIYLIGKCLFIIFRMLLNLNQPMDLVNFADCHF